MKKLLLIVFSICFLQALQAQELNTKTKRETTFGIKSGFISSSYTNSVSLNKPRGVGFYGGLFSETRFNKKWSFQNEVNFTITEGNIFIEIPLFLKYHINDKWSVFMGPKMDFLVTDSSRHYFGEGNYKTLGISAEIGVQYNLSEKLFIEGRYSHSFTNQLEYKKFDTRKRKTLRIGLGFKF